MWGDAEGDPDRLKAEFCLRLGVAPSEYDGLTDAEVEAFIDVFNEIVEEQRS